MWARATFFVLGRRAVAEGGLALRSLTVVEDFDELEHSVASSGPGWLSIAGVNESVIAAVIEQPVDGGWGVQCMDAPGGWGASLAR